MDQISHIGRPSLLTKEATHRLEPDRLVWSAQGRENSLPYTDIESLQLITYSSFGSMAGQCTIKGGGKTLTIRSHHFAGPGSFEDRTASYSPFVRALATRVAEANPAARFIAGSLGLWIAWMVVGIAALAVLGLLGMALLSGGDIRASALSALVIIVGGAALGLREVRKGPAKTFDLADPPC